MTAGEMVIEISEQITGPRGSDPSATRRVMAAINRVSRRIHARNPRWDWLWGQTTMAVTATTTGDLLPADCRNVTWAVSPTTGLYLDHKDLHLIQLQDGLAAIAGPGVPAEWDARGRYLYLRPYPSAAQNIVLGRFASYVPLTAPIDTPQIPADFHHVIVDMALADLTASDSFDRGMHKHFDDAGQAGLADLMHTSKTAQPYFNYIPATQGENVRG